MTTYHESDPNQEVPSANRLEKVLSEVGNAVYAATRLFEELEHAQLLEGNGHHARQEVALRAQKIVFDRWADQDEKGQLSPSHPVKNIVSD